MRKHDNAKAIIAETKRLDLGPEEYAEAVRIAERVAQFGGDVTQVVAAARGVQLDRASAREDDSNGKEDHSGEEKEAQENNLHSAHDEGVEKT